MNDLKDKDKEISNLDSPQVRRLSKEKKEELDRYFEKNPVSITIRSRKKEIK